MTENNVSIFEFSSLTGLTIQDIAKLLDRGAVKFIAGEDGGLLIDVSKLDRNLLAGEYINTIYPGNREVSESTITECSAEISPLIEQIIEEATILAFKWLEEDSSSE